MEAGDRTAADDLAVRLRRAVVLGTVQPRADLDELADRGEQRPDSTPRLHEHYGHAAPEGLEVHVGQVDERSLGIELDTEGLRNPIVASVVGIGSILNGVVPP